MRRLPHSRRAFWFEQLLLACVCVLVSLPKLANTFVWDDLALLVESDVLYDLHNVGFVFANDAMFPSDGGAFARVAQLDTYRPVTLLSFMLDGAVWGKRPLAFHITNLLLHIGCVTMLYALLLARVGPERRRHAWWLAAVFELHPLLTEAHVWINGRSDPLCTLLVLVAVWSWRRAEAAAALHGARRLAWGLSCGLSFLAAMLSKEVAVMVLPALLAWSAMERPAALRPLARARQAFMGVLPFLIALPVYLGARLLALSGLKTHAGAAHAELALARVGFLLLDGLARSIVPVHTSLRYLREEYARVPAGVFALAWLLVVAALLWAFQRRAREPGLFWGALWYASTLAPASLITGLQWYGFGRYLYLPLAGLLIGTAPATASATMRGLAQPRLSRLLVPAGIGYLVLLALICVDATTQWRDQLTLYRAIVDDQPERSHGHGGLGKWLIEHGHPHEAIPELERALALEPNDSRYFTNLGNAYLLTGRADAASSIARQGVQRFAAHASLWRLWARASAISDGDASVAMTAALEALRLEPQAQATRALLAELLAPGPRRDDRAQALAQLLERPRFAELAPIARTPLQPSTRRE
jgi:tetratricopeptide (TPR) repeat protein